MIVFAASEETVQATVIPTYSILGFIEGIGGFTVVILFLAKYCVSGLERSMLEADLIRSFYQVEKESKPNFDESKERQKPPRIISRD